MDQYNAELEHLGDHCHTSIIPDRYLKIPIYFLDIFFREKKVTHFIMCAAPKPKLFFPNAAFGEFAKRKVSGELLPKFLIGSTLVFWRAKMSILS